MNISSGGAAVASPQATTSAEVRGAQLTNKQIAIEGQIALQLTNSAAQPSGPQPVGNSGHNINIAV